MADIKIIETFDDSSVIQELTKVEQILTEIGNEGDRVAESLSGMYETAASETKAFNTAINATEATMKRQSAAVKQSSRDYGLLGAQIKQTVLGIQLGGKSLEEWIEHLDTFKTVGKGAVGTMEGMTLAQRALNLVVRAFPLVAIISVIVSVIAYFAKFQEGIDKVSRVMAAANAVIDRLITNVGNVGKALLNIASGNFTEGFQQLTDSVNSLSNGLYDAAVNAYNVEAAFQALRDAQIAASTEIERQLAAYEKLRDVGADDTLQARERLKALREAALTEENISVQRVTFARQQVELIRQQNAIMSDSVERRQALADAEKNLIEVEKEAAAQQREIAQEIRQIQIEEREKARQAAEERRKEIEKIRKEYESLIKTVNQQNQALALDNENNPVIRVNEQWRQAIKEAEALRTQLLRLAPTAEDSAFVDQQISELFGRINKKYEEQLFLANEELARLRKEITTNVADALPQTDALRSRVEFSNRAFIALLKSEYEQEVVPEIERILTAIAETFQLKGTEVISRQEAEQIFAGLKGAFADAYEGYRVLGEIEIEQQQRKVDQLQESLDKQQEIVDKQKELADKGLSNDLAIEEKRLRQTQALRDAAEKRRLELARRSANAQLAVDSLQQASSLATAAGNIVKAESNKGLLGVAFAIGAIAFMFKIFAQAKANALKFSEPPKLRRGRRLTGPSHEEGGIDIYFPNENRPRFNAERGEWVVNREASEEHDKHLSNINSGKYRGVKIDEAIRRGQMFETQAHLIAGMNTNSSVQADLLLRLLFETKRGNGDIVRAIEQRPSIVDGKTVSKRGSVEIIR